MIWFWKKKIQRARNNQLVCSTMKLRQPCVLNFTRQLLCWPGWGPLPLGCPVELLVLWAVPGGSAGPEYGGTQLSGKGRKRSSQHHRNGSLRAAGKAERSERQGRLEVPELWESQSPPRGDKGRGPETAERVPEAEWLGCSAWSLCVFSRRGAVGLVCCVFTTAPSICHSRCAHTSCLCVHCRVLWLL